MAIKHHYSDSKTSEEMRDAWQETNRRRYHSPQKIEFREARDRAQGLNRSENWRRREEGNVYSDREWMEENAAGNVRRKPTTEQIIRNAFRNKKK